MSQEIANVEDGMSVFRATEWKCAYPLVCSPWLGMLRHVVHASPILTVKVKEIQFGNLV